MERVLAGLGESILRRQKNYDNQPKQYLIINSTALLKTQQDGQTNFTLQIAGSGLRLNGLKLIQASIPNTIYNINSHNNKLYFYIREIDAGEIDEEPNSLIDSPYYIIIPDGNYGATSMAQALESQFNNGQWYRADTDATVNKPSWFNEAGVNFARLRVDTTRFFSTGKYILSCVETNAGVVSPTEKIQIKFLYFRQTAGTYEDFTTIENTANLLDNIGFNSNTDWINIPESGTGTLLDPFVNLLSGITSPFVVRLFDDATIYVRSNSFVGQNVVDFNGNITTILAAIPIDNSFGGILNYKPENPLLCMLPAETNIKQFNIRLTDKFDDDVDLNGAQFSLVFEVM
jgi:hypothetical protein